MPEIEIRDNPKFRSFLRNITETSFTGIMWGVWLYLLFPLVNIVLWLLGIKNFHLRIIEEVGYKELIALIEKIGLTVVTVFLVLRLWGYYNYRRFGMKNRRSSSPAAHDYQMARHFNMPFDDIKKLQSEKEISWKTVDDDQGIPPVWQSKR